MTERKRTEGRPWFLVLELFPDTEKGFRDISDLDLFCVTIRETGTTRIIADMTTEPMEYPQLCANALTRAQAIVREAGPEGSDFEKLYLWSDDKKCVIELSGFIPNHLSVGAPPDSGSLSWGVEDFSERVYYPVDDLLTRLRGKP